MTLMTVLRTVQKRGKSTVKEGSGTKKGVARRSLAQVCRVAVGVGHFTTSLHELKA